MNKAIIGGVIVRDPVKKELPSGKTVMNFTILTVEKYEAQGEEKVSQAYNRCVAFGAAADKLVTAGVAKGTKIVVEGKIATRSFQNQMGDTQYVTEINVFSFSLPEEYEVPVVKAGGGSSTTAEPAGKGAGSSANKGGEDEISPDDIPF